MTECKFPDYAMHKSWHQGFVTQIETISEKLKAEGATIVLVAEVNMKVGQLITHIKTLDSKLAQFLKANGK
jgi:hemerythrin